MNQTPQFIISGMTRMSCLMWHRNTDSNSEMAKRSNSKVI